MNLEQFSQYACERVNRYLDLTLSDYAPANGLQDAMRYSLFNGGKRVRPMLTYAVAQLFAEPNELTDACAAAVESVHAYSLVHDDLPAMDDDDLRRGKPTCHIQFDEATAILAGDALQTFAFELLCQEKLNQPTNQLAVINTLQQASGRLGMVTGQMIDLSNVNQDITLEDLELMHRHKTGAIIRAAVKMGAQSVGVTDTTQLQALDQYAAAIGLAFQVQDDIIDITSDTQTLGKTQFADADANKPTYPKLLGLEGAQALAQRLHDEAIEQVMSFGPKATPLVELANYIIARNH